MKTLSKNKKMAFIACAVMIISILAVSIGLIVGAVEKSRTVVADSDNGQMLSGKVYDMPKQLTLTDNMADGKTAAEGVNLKVILKPSFVANAKINFAIKWKDSAVTDDINTFLTLTEVNDTQCNIKMPQRFNNQIELVATAEVDKSITKTCAIDCYSYIESMKLTFEIHQKEVITDTGEYTSDGTDNTNIGNNNSEIAGLNNFNIDYYTDTYLVMKGDYTFGLGTKLVFEKIVSNFKFMSEFNGKKFDIDLGKTIILTDKIGTFEHVTEKFNLNYFYDTDYFSTWYPAYFEDCKRFPEMTQPPQYDSSKDFYRNNVNRLMENFFYRYTLDFFYFDPNPVEDVHITPEQAVIVPMVPNINYLYDMSFDDSVVMD